MAVREQPFHSSRCPNFRNRLTELQSAEAAQVKNRERRNYLQDQVRQKTSEMESQSGIRTGCGFAILTYFVGPVVYLAYPIFKQTAVTGQSMSPFFYSFWVAVVVGVIATQIGRWRKQAPFKREITEIEAEFARCDRDDQELAQRRVDATKDIAELRALSDRLLLKRAALSDIPLQAQLGNWSVTLSNPGPNIINTIKLIRELTGLDLKGARVLVDCMPSLVLTGIDLSKAEEVSTRFKAVGAVATVTQDGNNAQI